jgi:hypothetical protein
MSVKKAGKKALTLQDVFSAIRRVKRTLPSSQLSVSVTNIPLKRRSMANMMARPSY